MLTKIKDLDNDSAIRKMFYEDESGLMQLGYNVDNVILDEITELGQHITIFDSAAFGRTLVIDGMVQNSVKTEMVYNEMMVHMPLDCMKNPKDVLIIGGGSGLTCLQCLKYDTVQNITLCDISDEIIRISRQYFPDYYTESLRNKKVHIVIEDGFEYVKRNYDRDAILVDCCDPIGCADVLYHSDFYDSCIKALNETGILCVQNGAPLFENGRKEYQNLHKILEQRKDIKYTDILFTCPMIVGGFYLFTMITKDLSKDWSSSYHLKADDCEYYNPAMRPYYMELPGFIRKFLI